MTTAPPEPLDAAEEELRKAISTSEVPVILAVTASDSPACDGAGDIIGEADRQLQDRAAVFHLEADSCLGLMREYRIETVPALLGIHNGRLFALHVGALEPGDIAHMLDFGVWQTSDDQRGKDSLFH